ncbi:MAG: ABC transporter [Burkholderiales bacterium PBB5]|nr:MAG: ABC transporter [Burkholderiales bacterium PBB5]
MRLALGAASLAVALLAGCASLPEPRAVPLPIPGEIVTHSDPWEPFNRRMFAFNEAVDKAVLKPAAQVFQAVVPQWLRNGLGNMLGNLGDAWSAANLLVQVKPRAAIEMTARVMFNTVLGLGGFIDIADEVGLQRASSEDLGQTLGVWGIPSGPYVVLPFLGPSTVRDGLATISYDMSNSGPNLVFNEPRDRNSASVVQLLNTRVNLLNAGRVLDDIALDKYVLLRDAYLARRRSQIYDGDPPDDEPAPAPAASASAPAAAAPAPAEAASAAAPAASAASR